MIGGRFMATRVDSEAPSQIKKTVNMTSFFQNQLALTPKKPIPRGVPNAPASEEKIPEKENIC